ncbi:MAG: hypothetical protein WC325_13290 [Candidatus Bathyarchaeia archaeon]|jgi:hypothetical protein
MANHPIKKGPCDGRFQQSRAGKRYLLDGPVKTGPQNGHFQGRGENKRYLLAYGKKR